MAEIYNIQSAEDFFLDSVILSSERLIRDINLTNLVAEINIYESINQLYLTGSISLLDDQNAFGSIDIQGTERLQITISQYKDQDIDPFVKNFIIVNINKSIKPNNDHTTVYDLYMIEDIGYLNNVKKISKAYDGKPESMIEKIIRRNIGKNTFGYNITTRTSETFKSSAQALKRYIAPYITPFDAVNNILERTTTTAGFPFFAYSSFMYEEMFIRDLETIIKDSPFNKGQPFVYSQSMSNNAAENIYLDAFRISEFTSNLTDDTMLLAEKGAIGSIIQTLDASYGDKSISQFNAYNFFDRLKDLNSIPDNSKYLVDKNFIPDNKENNPSNLQSYTSRVFRQISANITTENNINNLYSEVSISDNNLPVYAYILKEYLMKNLVTITVPGLHFLVKDRFRTVGNQIEIATFKSSIPSVGIQDYGRFTDPRKSGNFIMLNKRHIFDCTSFKHNCVIQCGRIQREAI